MEKLPAFLFLVSVRRATRTPQAFAISAARVLALAGSCWLFFSGKLREMPLRQQLMKRRLRGECEH